MDLISVSIEPRGPIISGEEGRWLSAQRWINMHNVLLAADCTGPHRDMLIPPAPVEAVLLLRGGEIIPFTGYDPHDSDVVASSGEGYTMWAPLPPAADQGTGDSRLPAELRWDVVLGAQPIIITLFSGVQLLVGADGCSVDSGDPSSVNLYPIFEDGVLAGETNQITIFHKGNLLLVCAELWAYACNVGPQAPSVSVGDVVTPSADSPIGNDLWAALAGAASIRLGALVVTQEGVQVGGSVSAEDLVFSDGEGEDDAEGLDDLSGQSLRGTLLELLTLESSVDFLKQQLAQALASLNTARDELSAKSAEIMDLQLAIASLQSGAESLSQRLLLLEQDPKCCCRCCGAESCSCGSPDDGDSGGGGVLPGDPLPPVPEGLAPPVLEEGSPSPVPDVTPGDEDEVERIIDVLPPDQRDYVDPGLGRPQPIPGEVGGGLVDNVTPDDADKVAFMVRLPWNRIRALELDAFVKASVTYYPDDYEQLVFDIASRDKLFIQYTGESGWEGFYYDNEPRDYHGTSKHCWHDIIESLGICIPVTVRQVREIAAEHGKSATAVAKELEKLTPETEVATWWAAYWEGVKQFDPLNDSPWSDDPSDTLSVLDSLAKVVGGAVFDSIRLPRHSQGMTALAGYSSEGVFHKTLASMLAVFHGHKLAAEYEFLRSKLAERALTLSADNFSAVYEIFFPNTVIVDAALAYAQGAFSEAGADADIAWMVNAIAAELDGLLEPVVTRSGLSCSNLVNDVLSDINPPPEGDSEYVPNVPFVPLTWPPTAPGSDGFMQVIVLSIPNATYAKKPEEIWPGIGAYWNNPLPNDPGHIESPYLRT